MNYIITEGKTDALLFSKIFNREIKSKDWTVTPIGGGQSEAVSLAISLAYRHRKDGKIVLIIDSDGEIDDNNFNVRRIKSRFEDYDNVCIIFSVPDMEAEMIRMLNLDKVLPELSTWNRTISKDTIRKKAIEVIDKRATNITPTDFYNNVKHCLEQWEVGSAR